MGLNFLDHFKILFFICFFARHRFKSSSVYFQIKYFYKNLTICNSHLQKGS